MNAVERWAEDKPKEIAGIAIMLALSASGVSEALTEMRDQADTYISQSEISQWLLFYRNHRQTLDLLNKLLTFDGFQELMMASLEGDESQVSAHTKEQLIDLYKQPITLYFLEVWAPCAIYYKTTPTTLFRKARLGKISAYEKLLRLDNSIIFDKKLSEIFHHLKTKPNKREYRKLLLAFHKPVTGKSDPKHIKTLASATITLATEAIGKRLTEPQIRKLFDAIAVDRGHGLQDEEIPATPDTFAQAIRRETKKMKNRDKNPYKR